MDSIAQWIVSHANPTVVISAVLSFLLGLSIVKAKLAKAVTLIGDLADLLSQIKSALADGKIDAGELEGIVKDGEQLLADWKK